MAIASLVQGIGNQAEIAGRAKRIFFTAKRKIHVEILTAERSDVIIDGLCKLADYISVGNFPNRGPDVISQIVFVIIKKIIIRDQYLDEQIAFIPGI